MSPVFDRPCFTRPAAEVMAAPGPQRPLPAMLDPAPRPVVDPVDDPLVAVEHRRIRVLSNYWHGGWANAVRGCWLRAPAMERLARVADALPEPFGLAVFDAWRPMELQIELYEMAYADESLPPGFVAEPSRELALPPPHLTGGTVDVTLTFDGTPIAAGTGFDDLTDRARTHALEDEPGADREVRRMLYWAMASQDFVVLDCEWWHFEYGTTRWAAIADEQPLFGPTRPSDRRYDAPQGSGTPGADGR